MFNTDAILNKTNLRDLVSKAGGELVKDRCACPIHGGHDTTGFSIYNKDGRDLWCCFSGDCGSGDAIRFIEVWRGLDFKRACAFLGGEVQDDPVEMKRLADERMEKARVELADKQARHEAARRELQVAEIHLRYHKDMKDWARAMWTGRGLDDGMQDFFTLGSCENFAIGDGYETPTLTIPILGEHRQLLNIKHRLIRPLKPKDKYRPERSGLGSFPAFLAIPEMGYDGDLIIITEGEIKAMVTWTSLNISDFQVIGVPGRTQFKAISEKLNGKNVIVIPDPGAEKDAHDFAKSIKARYMPTPDKIDDYILSTHINSNELYAMLKQARLA